ncbi:MAG: hypothetical protein RMK29_19540 [Myxococcales bacterium]|nr:hypothetical protein [Myxococcales bacterium]
MSMPSKPLPCRHRPGLVAALLCLGACTVPQTPMRECTGKSYSSYLNEILEATLAYEKRCGLLDASGARDAQRRALFYTRYPAFLTEIRDKAAMERRTGYDASCFVNMLREAPCGRDTVLLAQQACSGPNKDAFGCLGPGRLCSLPEECAEGYCRGIPAGSACGSGTCVAWGGVGAPCPEGNIACDPRVAYCKGGVCQPLEAENVACEADHQCESGLVCVRAQVGDIVGKCARPKVGQENEPCSLVAKVGQSCAPGLACFKDASGTYRCQRPAKVGERCTTTEACEGTATCVRMQSTDETGRCQPPGQLGAECTSDPNLGGTCQLTLSCFTFDPMAPAVCQPQPENNQRCAQNLSCLTGICDTTLAEPRCRPKSGAGLACTTNSDCVSDQCDPVTRRCKEPVCR